MLPQYFFIIGYEVGADQAGTLQYYDGTNWTDLGNWVTVNQSIVINNDHNPIPVNYKTQQRNINGDLLYNVDGSPLWSVDGIFYPGATWQFRLVDNNGFLISNIISFTFPNDQQPLENIGGQPLENLDGSPLLNT